MYYLTDKIVLITGGTGSLGQALVSKLCEARVKKIIVYSRHEYSQVEMERRFSKEKYPIRYFIGDVRDRDRLHRAMEDVNVVIHTAAIKHIDKAQYDPFEAVKTNVVGAQNVIDISIDYGIDKVIAISTDKSVNPTSLYGASKLCSDFMFVAANNYSPGKTKFSVVRFGNFWGSSGSIVEYLMNLPTSKKHEIKLTHSDMTRFFITLEEASSFIVRFLDIMKGQEIFSPKMRARRIVDIIKELQPKSITKLIGLRPGEKLYEEMIIPTYAANTYEVFDNDGKSDFYVTVPDGDYKYCEGSVKKANPFFNYNSQTVMQEQFTKEIKK